MGNAAASGVGGGASHSRHKDSLPNSPPHYTAPSGSGSRAQAFTFDKKIEVSQEEEEEPYNITKSKTSVNPDLEGSDSASVHSETNSTTMSNKAAADAAQAEQDELNSRHQALPTVLRWDGGGRNVLISGTFTQWKAIPMVKSHANFVAIIDLPEGDHQYKFCVDGEWKHDRKTKCVENEHGGMNNLVSVRQSDFEVFQALAKDSEDVPNLAEKEYSQEVPQDQHEPWKQSAPPVLPPQLLQVILNKDTPLSCEPTLLPEPNHVMLNHLYALSIKDGVMVLSATHRYRKKYVTTLLYKPI